MKSAHSRSTFLFFLVIACACPNASGAFAQSDSDQPETVHGVVVNSVTGEPIARALVHSADNRFAILTNSEGRFEFAVEKPSGDSSESKNPGGGPTSLLNGPNMLIALKPGYLADSGNFRVNSQNDSNQEWTLRLTPEALIVGTVSLPTSEAPDSISLQIFRREVQDGHARYVPAGITRSRSDGQFRFADLRAGTYKLLTQEMLDQDPATLGPEGPVFGYPPVFYPNAPDFASAATINLVAGQMQTVNLTLVRQRYYEVKIPVSVAGKEVLENGISVDVYTQGRKGPGFSLGYSNNNHAVAGLLPNGLYTIDVTSYGPGNESGTQTIAIKGGPVRGPAITLAPSESIVVNVAEEFTSGRSSPYSAFSSGGKTVELKGPRRYLNILLAPADEGIGERMASLRNSPENADGPLSIEAPPPGNYWVQVHSSFGYAASVRSGNVDLLHQPLAVGSGWAGPIEITMRDDTAEISGTVEGIKGQGTRDSNPAGAGFYVGGSIRQPGTRVYCVPLPDSAGQFAEGVVNPDGSFDFANVAPGAYRVLAFDGTQDEIEYRNPDAMRAYESKGTVVRVGAGQKEEIAVALTGEN